MEPSQEPVGGVPVCPSLKAPFSVKNMGFLQGLRPSGRQLDEAFRSATPISRHVQFLPTSTPSLALSVFLRSGFGEKEEIDQTRVNFRQIDFVQSKQKKKKGGVG